ncbi:MAG: hypothetical protein K2P26_02450 [Oscillospiraceae bacterium]|nr:hypothetical protein [Oscillospiraceae bacterium]
MKHILIGGASMGDQPRDIFAEARLFLKKAALKKEGWILDGYYEHAESGEEEPDTISEKNRENLPA